MSESADDNVTRKKKKRESKLQEKNQNIDISVRKDVICKSILRKMKKYFLEAFNAHTLYRHKKRYREEEYYGNSLRDYIQNKVKL